MLKIAEFSRLTQVPAKTLRYYDEIGLFHPSQVDPLTGYRWYAIEQISHLNRILVLRDLGVPLAQITQMIQEEISIDELRGMLRLRRAKILQQLEEDTRQLVHIEARLQQIEHEGRVPNYEVVVKHVDACWVIGQRALISDLADIGSVVSGQFQRIFSYLHQNGCNSIGGGIGLYFDQEFQATDISLATTIPIAEPIDSNGSLECWQLPAVPHMACTIHRGPYLDLGEAHAALLRWIDTNGYAVGIPYREIYLQFGNEPSQFVTELQYPLLAQG
jgi:DNA-binding transcriptional MerR regulator